MSKFENLWNIQRSAFAGRPNQILNISLTEVVEDAMFAHIRQKRAVRKPPQIHKASTVKKSDPADIERRDPSLRW